MVKSLEYPFYKERLRELELFSLEKRRPNIILLMCINNSWEAVNETRQWFPLSGDGHKLKYRKCCLDMRKNSCTVRVLNRLPREAVESPLLELSKPHLNMTLTHQV